MSGGELKDSERKCCVWSYIALCSWTSSYDLCGLVLRWSHEPRCKLNSTSITWSFIECQKRLVCDVYNTVTTNRQIEQIRSFHPGITSILGRHGICQFFYTSKIAIFQFYPRKTLKLRHCWLKIENIYSIIHFNFIEAWEIWHEWNETANGNTFFLGNVLL